MHNGLPYKSFSRVNYIPQTSKLGYYKHLNHTEEEATLLPTLILPACDMMELNIVLQTRYEAVHAIVPSLPERIEANLKHKGDRN